MFFSPTNNTITAVVFSRKYMIYIYISPVFVFLVVLAFFFFFPENVSKRREKKWRGYDAEG